MARKREQLGGVLTVKAKNPALANNGLGRGTLKIDDEKRGTGVPRLLYVARRPRSRVASSTTSAASSSR